MNPSSPASSLTSIIVPFSYSSAHPAHLPLAFFQSPNGLCPCTTVFSSYTLSFGNLMSKINSLMINVLTTQRSTFLSFPISVSPKENFRISFPDTLWTTSHYLSLNRAKRELLTLLIPPPFFLFTLTNITILPVTQAHNLSIMFNRFFCLGLFRSTVSVSVVWKGLEKIP